MAAERHRSRTSSRWLLTAAATVTGGALALQARPIGVSRRGRPPNCAFATNPATCGLQQHYHHPYWYANVDITLGTLATRHRSPPQKPRTRGPAASWFHASLRRLWSLSDGFMYVMCGMVGASFVFSNLGSSTCRGALAVAGGDPIGQAALVAASAGLTSFGGGTQSTLLHWLGHRCQASDGMEVPPMRFSWQSMWPHVWTLLGVILASSLHWTGRLGHGAWWRWAVSLNSALFVTASTGWFSDKSPRGHLLRMAGVLLYCCGGGMWRDLLSARVPTALSFSFLIPAGLGLSLCVLLQEQELRCKSAKQREGIPAAALGVPAVTCLFNAFA